MTTLPILELVRTAITLMCGSQNIYLNPYLNDEGIVPKGAKDGYLLCVKEVRKCNKEFLGDGLEMIYRGCLDRARLENSYARVEAGRQ